MAFLRQLVVGVNLNTEVFRSIDEAIFVEPDYIDVQLASTAFYDACAEKCMEGRLDVTSYNNRKVEGSVTAAKDGILFLSIPAYDNWDIYIDGKKADRIDNLDITFTGVSIPAGKHEITLRYNNRIVKYGGVVSAAGLILLVISRVAAHRRRKRAI